MGGLIDFIEKEGDKRKNKETFESIKNIGYIITDDIYDNVKVPKNWRVYGAPALQTSETKKGIITIGPFPIKREDYNGIITSITNEFSSKRLKESKDSALAIMLAPYKLQFEYFGVITCFDKISIQEEDLINIGSFISYIYDMYNPIETKNFYWIVPDNSKKGKIIEAFGLVNSEHKERWWNIKTKVIMKVEELNLNHYDDSFMVPTVISGIWNDYITASVLLCLFELYSIGTKNKKYRKINKEELDRVLRKSIENMYKENFSNDPDKEIMLAKLYIKNNIEVPIDVGSLYKFLIKTEFLIEETINTQKYYWVAKMTKCKKPEDIFILDEEFKRDLDLYKKTGSIILNYIPPEKYVSLTTDY